ncbi:unnamed protein product [Brassica oleracea var. botrytis]|uniref:(rape) hypothetical protein n=1 Tax=Brassica napus TaxID=3708 RepID=A0A816KGV9_BRANA|nr:unnamed protein product [Brassica napus]
MKLLKAAHAWENFKNEKRLLLWIVGLSIMLNAWRNG